jgi:hypothetical protein
MEPFYIRAGGRMMRVTVLRSFEATGDDWHPVDVRDIGQRTESQAIIAEATVKAGPLALMADSQMRACVASVYMNATGFEDGDPIGGRRMLPDGFTIEVQTPATWEAAGIDPDPDEI